MKPTKDFKINLYPKTLRGQRAYKRSIPRFIAISNWGYCIKWNSDVSHKDFYTVAKQRLCDAIECGGVWVVVILFRPDPRYQNPAKVFFEVRFSPDEIDKYYKIKEQHIDFLKKIHNLKVRCMRAYVTHAVKTTKEYLNFFEEQIKELFNVCPNQLTDLTEGEQYTMV